MVQLIRFLLHSLQLFLVKIYDMFCENVKVPKHSRKREKKRLKKLEAGTLFLIQVLIHYEEFLSFWYF